MSFEWPLVSLEALADEVTVGFVGTMADQYVEAGVPFLRSLNIEPFAVKKTDLKCISPEFHAKLKKSALRPGDVAIVRTGKPGTCAVIPEWLGEANCSDLVLVRCGPRLRPEFLSYWVNAAAANHIAANLVGAVQQHFNVSAAKRMLVACPPLAVQDNLIELVASINDRITLLRETNATLEAIAQALFKSWFVDFDPVRAKMEGRTPEGMDEATAALFPDGLETSELGEVPRGWRVGSVYDISKVIYGAPFASKLFKATPPGRPLVRIRDLKDERPGVFTEEVHPKGYLLQPGDIAVGMDGEFRAYVWGGETAWLNQRVCVFHPINGACSAFVRLSIAPLLAVVEASETATTVIHLGKNDIDRFRVILPSSAVLATFAAVAEPVYGRLVLNKQKVHTLSTLRDTLLPRLISGQLRLSEAQAATEAALGGTLSV